MDRWIDRYFVLYVHSTAEGHIRAKQNVFLLTKQNVFLLAKQNIFLLQVQISIKYILYCNKSIIISLSYKIQ